MLREDPQGTRAYTDFLARSWVSWRSKDPRRDGLRNAPTIFDSALMPRLHFDGEFDSLEGLVKGTISGRTLGWLPGEEEQAFEQAYRFIRDDAGEGTTASYRDQFKSAFGVDLRDLKRDEVIALVARAVSEFMKTLRTEMKSPYDQFVRANGLSERPEREEAPVVFAQRLLTRLTSLEAEGRLKLTKDFSADALKGLKIFLRAKGDASVGNCAACHAPPQFADFSFHNIGTSQSEYDRLHGEGSFAALAIPDFARASRPAVQFREIPSRDKPGVIDLGHWNFVDVRSSPLRRAGEKDDQFLERMIATFKTPTLRNLAFTYPYMHNGAYASLESVLKELMRLSSMARSGRVRAADEELARIRISEADLLPLIAFLNALNEDF